MTKEKRATSSVQRVVRRRWKYYRDTQNGHSKWVLDGRNWVTKWDGESCCIIGINGERGADYYGTVWEARRHVERLSPPNGESRDRTPNA